MLVNKNAGDNAEHLICSKLGNHATVAIRHCTGEHQRNLSIGLGKQRPPGVREAYASVGPGERRDLI